MKLFLVNLLLVITTTVSFAGGEPAKSYPPVVEEVGEKIGQIAAHAESIGAHYYKLRCRSYDIEDDIRKQRIRNEARHIMKTSKQFIKTLTWDVFRLAGSFYDCLAAGSTGPKCDEVRKSIDGQLARLEGLDKDMSRLNNEITEITKKQDSEDADED